MTRPTRPTETAPELTPDDLDHVVGGAGADLLGTKAGVQEERSKRSTSTLLSAQEEKKKRGLE
ncbi:MAG: hypothetical protein H6983_05115 [Ectothiorhodospiraceae bacterium]|nr:hypothetical protein [Ectothiorhodospiraceae bacterium]